MAADERQVLVRFVTKLPAELRVPETPVAVPASLKRYEFSKIINQLLSLDPARPFDFIIAGELLRKSLDDHLLDRGLSAEAVLDVEYVPAVVPPKQRHSAPHDDWVSTVQGMGSSSAEGSQKAISGSYDGCLRIWDLTGEAPICSTSWQAHPGGVNAVACVPSQPQLQAGQQLVASSGKDQRVLLWQVSPTGHTLIASYSGHTDAVDAVAASPDGRVLATGGWDGALLLWRTGQAVVEAAAESVRSGEAAAAAAPAKKRKGSTQGGPAGDEEALAPEGGLKEEAQARFEGHVHCVASLGFATASTLFSGGWDHSVRRWDVSTGINTDTYSGSKVVCSIACPHESTGTGIGAPGSVVAFGCSDRVLRLWDARSRQGEALSLKSLPGHAGWVVGLAWSPSSSYHVATASHDHTVKLWDLRSNVPLATLATHSDKVLCVAWPSARMLLSGSADCQLHSHAMETAYSA